jgi:hypothetical protein
MDLKKLTLAVATGFTLLAAAPAFADPQYWAPAHGWRHHHHHYRAPAYVYVPAAPVYYYPPPAPVIYGQLPVGHRAQIGFRVRL